MGASDSSAKTTCCSSATRQENSCGAQSVSRYVLRAEPRLSAPSPAPERRAGPTSAAASTRVTRLQTAIANLGPDLFEEKNVMDVALTKPQHKQGSPKARNFSKMCCHKRSMMFVVGGRKTKGTLRYIRHGRHGVRCHNHLIDPKRTCQIENFTMRPSFVSNGVPRKEWCRCRLRGVRVEGHKPAVQVTALKKVCPIKSSKW